jgi:hypothetical protein
VLPDLTAGWGRAWVVGDVAELRLGARRYELSDWLGSMRVVVTDQRLPIYKGKRLVGYRAEVVEMRNYYRYGLDISEIIAAPSIPIATPSMVRKTFESSGGIRTMEHGSIAGPRRSS